MIERKILKISPVTEQVIGEYPTIAEAARVMNVDESSIRKRLNHPTRTCKGYRWAETFVDKGTEVKPSESRAKILLLDIETAPIAAYVWGLWDQNVFGDQIISDWFMLTWAAKWLGEEEVFSNRLSSLEAVEEDDSRIVKKLWSLLDEADVVIAHNGIKFDIPKINSRFLVHGFMPPSTYKQIDTLKVARNHFGFSSNKLQSLAQLFGFDGKNDTDFNLWKKSMKGVREALVEMEQYNAQDVRVLEDVYVKLRPYIKGHPNLDLYMDDEKPHCPSCGSIDITVMHGKFFYTQAVKYKQYRCNNCGAVSRAKSGEKYENKKQISAIPR
jgi:hypothetical protein